MSPYKCDTPTFVDNKGYPCGPAFWTTVLGFKYVYRIDINLERLISCSNKHNLHLKNILCRFCYFSPSSKVWQVVVASKCPVQSALQPSLSCFLLMLLTESFYLFLLASLE